MNTQEMNTQDTTLAAFLGDLTALSVKHKIGIVPPAVLFVLEDDDVDLTYQCDAESNLTF